MGTVKFFQNRSVLKTIKTTKEKEEEEKKVQIYCCYYSGSTGTIEKGTGEKCPVSKWNKKGSYVKGNEAETINKKLSNIRGLLISFEADYPGLTHEKAREYVTHIIKTGEPPINKPVKKKDVLHVVTDFCSECREEKAGGTVKRYEALLAKLEEFSKLPYDDDDAKKNIGWPLALDMLDFNFYDRFKRFLYQIPNPYYGEYSLYQIEGSEWEMRQDNEGLKVGLFDATVYKYLIHLKTVLKWGEDRVNGINVSHRKWKIIRREDKPISLTFEELEKLEKLETDNEAIAIARDYLALECRIGQRISDIKKIRKDQIDHEKKRWKHKPKKGSRMKEKEVTVHFTGYCEPAYSLLAKYNFEMPKIAENWLNLNIKEACKLAGINEPIFIERWAGNKKVKISGEKWEFLSTHTGRRTFITLTLQFMPHKVVKDLAGINSFKTLALYESLSQGDIVEQHLEDMQENNFFMKIAS